MMKKTCCIIGQSGLTEPQLGTVMDKLLDTVKYLAAQNYTYFITGGSNETELFAALMIIMMKYTNKDLRMELALPCNAMFEFGSNALKGTGIMCDNLSKSQERYDDSCVEKRNQYMLEKSDIILAIWDGKISGKTFDLIKLAKSKEKEVQSIMVT